MKQSLILAAVLCAVAFGAGTAEAVLVQTSCTSAADTDCRTDPDVEGAKQDGADLASTAMMHGNPRHDAVTDVIDRMTIAAPSGINPIITTGGSVEAQPVGGASNGTSVAQEGPKRYNDVMVAVQNQEAWRQDSTGRSYDASSDEVATMQLEILDERNQDAGRHDAMGAQGASMDEVSMMRGLLLEEADRYTSTTNAGAIVWIYVLPDSAWHVYTSVGNVKLDIARNDDLFPAGTLFPGWNLVILP